VPVIVVGNIIVGGAGKTPLTLWLAGELRQRGWRPGIVSRGYGGDRGASVRPVTLASSPAEVGDEPLLLARRSGVPVWVGRQRAAAGEALLAAHPEIECRPL
jgi:tetraacyldisaccharide 4'-kinase